MALFEMISSVQKEICSSIAYFEKSILKILGGKFVLLHKYANCLKTIDLLLFILLLFLKLLQAKDIWCNIHVFQRGWQLR